MLENLQDIIAKHPDLKKLNDQKWRLNNLYFIKDKEGNKIRFTSNLEQKQIFYSLYLLDEVLWNDYIQAGILAKNFDDASSIFRYRLKFAFDHLHPALRPLFKVIGESDNELMFAHGSSIRVGTSLRGSALSLLHISENVWL